MRSVSRVIISNRSFGRRTLDSHRCPAGFGPILNPVGYKVGKFPFPVHVGTLHPRFLYMYSSNGWHQQPECSNSQAHRNADVSVIGPGPATLAAQGIWF